MGRLRTKQLQPEFFCIVQETVNGSNNKYENVASLKQLQNDRKSDSRLSQQ